ncbi:MAG TPA: cytochrome c [Candidatus Saccharimonadales bacterium]|nr:cytochrome c [Candidatus Saccharimonadales bacterium]
MSDDPKSCSTPPNAEPTATRSTVPMWIFALTLTLIYLGAVYFDHHSGWFDAKVYSPYASAEELEAYQPKSGAAAMLARGKQVYEQVCGLCHGVDGLGKTGQAPPLAGSEFVDAKGMQRLVHIPLTGVAGDIKVEGKDWNLSMAAMGAALSDSDLASVLTYIRNSWGNKAEAVTADDIKQVRAIVSKSPGAMTGDQLMKMAE